jgi:Tol biopolymer transport system component
MNADGSNPVSLTNNAPVNATLGLAPLPQSELNLDAIPYKIVYESYRETDGKKNWEICLINANGSGVINLTNTPEIDEMYPKASPDGRMICFEAVVGKDRESKSRNVYMMKIDGTDRIKIEENAWYPCWSPDCRYIAYLPGEYPRFSSNRRASKGLEIYDLKTGEKKRHPNDENIHFGRPCWSPNGEWFVAVGNNIKAFRIDNKIITNLSVIGCTSDISPDGKYLAWNSSDYHLNIGKLIFNATVNNVIDHRVVVACKHDHWVYDADWSPDKNYLAFNYGIIDDKAVVERAVICICDLRTGKWTQITTDGIHNGEPDWVVVQEQ